MPITFECECGKQLQAPDEFAGRRTKCKGCGKLLTIPAAATPPADQTPEIQEPEPEPKAELFEPAAAAFVEEPPPIAKPIRRSKSRPHNPWVDASLVQQVTHWQGNDKDRFGSKFDDSRGPSLMSLVAFLLVLSVIGGLCAIYWDDITSFYNRLPVQTLRNDLEQPAPPPFKLTDLDLVPRQAAAFATLRVAALWDGPTARLVRLADQQKAPSMLGLTPKQISRLTLVLHSIPSTEKLLQTKRSEDLLQQTSAWIAIQTAEPYDRNALIRRLTGNATPKTHQDKLYYPLRPQLAPDAYVHFFNDQLFAIASPTGITDLLDLRPAKDQPLQGPLRYARGPNHVVVGGTPPTETVKDVREMIAAQAPWHVDLVNFLWFAFVLNDVTEPMKETQIPAKVHLEYPDPQTAETAAATLSELLLLVKTLVNDSPSNWKIVPTNIATANNILTVLRPTVNKAQIQANGELVTIDLPLDRTALLVALLRLARPAPNQQVQLTPEENSQLPPSTPKTIPKNSP